ncbi:MAG: GFA family protein [Pseudomonadota bacterium]
MATNPGQCLCGKVRWSLSAEPLAASHCYCKMCRKAHGSEFATYWRVDKDHFHWVSGRDAIVTYDSSDILDRHFCGDCGSVVPFGGVSADGNVHQDYFVIVAGPHDQGRPADYNIFVAHKAPWTEIGNGLPAHDDYPVESGYGRVEDTPQGEAPEGVVRASCLCGVIKANIKTPFRAAHHCHCARCRRGRGAAHASNGFTAYDAVTFLQGETHLKEYKVPDAKYFTQVFCELCGAKMPRLDAGRGVAVIPLGCLDDAPGIAPADHIFVADKADWYPITDALPQYDGYPPPQR